MLFKIVRLIVKLPLLFLLELLLLMEQVTHIIKHFVLFVILDTLEMPLVNVLQVQLHTVQPILPKPQLQTNQHVPHVLKDMYYSGLLDKLMFIFVFHLILQWDVRIT
jgi:hypothetical protein